MKKLPGERVAQTRFYHTEKKLCGKFQNAIPTYASKNASYFVQHQELWAFSSDATAKHLNRIASSKRPCDKGAYTSVKSSSMGGLFMLSAAARPCKTCTCKGHEYRQFFVLLHIGNSRTNKSSHLFAIGGAGFHFHFI